MGEAKRRKQHDSSYGKVRRITPPLIPDGLSADFGWLVYQHLGESPFRLYLTEFVGMIPKPILVPGKKECYEIVGVVISGVMNPANLSLFAACAKKGAIATFEIEGSQQFAEECLKRLTTSPGATVRADFSRRFRVAKNKEDVMPLIFLAEEHDVSANESELIRQVNTAAQHPIEVFWFQ